MQPVKPLGACCVLALAACALDGAAGPSFEESLLGEAPERTEIRATVISPDGRFAAFRAQHRNREFVVSGGRRGEAFDWVIGLTLSPDGRTPAYRAQRDGKEYIVVGDEPRGPYDEVGWPRFSPDGRLVSYLSRTASRLFLVLGDREIRDFEEVGQVEFNPRDGTPAYWGRLGGREFVVVGDVRGEAFEKTGAPIFSSDIPSTKSRLSTRAETGSTSTEGRAAARSACFAKRTSASWIPERRSIPSGSGRSATAFWSGKS